jgi:hypothetical protein
MFGEKSDLNIKIRKDLGRIWPSDDRSNEVYIYIYLYIQYIYINTHKIFSKVYFHCQITLHTVE